MHHPSQWDLLTDGKSYELLPKLTQFQLIAGLNGIKSRQGGGIEATLAKVAMMEKGWVFIEASKGGDSGYLREFDGIRGPVYSDRWTTPRRLGTGPKGKVIWDHDKANFDDFRRSLLKDGTIAVPEPSTLDFLITLKEKRVQRKTNTAHIPHIQRKVEELIEEKQALETIKSTKKTKVAKAAKKKKAAPVET